MKKLLFLLIAVLLVSCSEDPEAETVIETSQVFKIEFQNGNLPDSNFSGIYETYIRSGGFQDINYNGATSIYAGKHSDDTISRVIFNLDFLPSYIPFDAEIVAAYLVLETGGTLSLDGTSNIDVNVLTFINGATQATWNDAYTGQTWSSPGGDFSSISSLINGDDSGLRATLKINPSALIANGLTTPGIIIRSKDEVLDSTNKYALIYSSEYGTVSSRPKLVIYYKL